MEAVSRAYKSKKTSKMASTSLVQTKRLLQSSIHLNPILQSLRTRPLRTKTTKTDSSLLKSIKRKSNWLIANIWKGLVDSLSLIMTRSRRDSLLDVQRLPKMTTKWHFPTVATTLYPQFELRRVTFSRKWTITTIWAQATRRSKYYLVTALLVSRRSPLTISLTSCRWMTRAMWGWERYW